MISEKEEKLWKIKRLVIECGNSLVLKFFDTESYKMLDRKIEILTALKEGKTISDIPDFYDILENYPKDEDWD